MRYIHQLDAWPKFTWKHEFIVTLLGVVRNRQGRLMGRMEAIGFALRSEALLQTLTLDVLKNSEIEGEILDPKQVRSSIARRLGMDIGGIVPYDRHVDGVVEMMLDATQNYDKPLTKDRLLGWHACLFPAGHSGMREAPRIFAGERNPARPADRRDWMQGKIVVGDWRDNSRGPMQVVSGASGRERVHFEAPDAARLDLEMKNFLDWFSSAAEIDSVLKAGIAHLWFATIHPFEDGNGRIARAITDMQLARADGSAQRFYSMSAQIRKERNTYYEVLEKIQKNTHMDITAWLEWFLACLDRSLSLTESTLADVFRKARFWELHPSESFNERQRMIINKLFDELEGVLTSSKWGKITKCSHDTALRDILELVEKGILIKNSAGGRSTSYLLKAGGQDQK